MTIFLYNLIGNLRGKTLGIDKRIPFTRFLLLLLNRFLGRFVAVLKFRRWVNATVALSSTILSPKQITMGKNLRIGKACFVDALSTDGIKLGNRVTLGKYTCIECTGSLADLGKGLKVGNNVGLGTHGFYGCAGGIEIGNDVLVGNYCSFHSENHNFEDISRPIRMQGVNRKGIKIGNNCWIGAKATILDGVEIGDGCVVAACALVTRGVYPANSVIGGIPAKVIKRR